jgi:prophage antirepressor-like protein
MEHPHGNALVRLTATFDGQAITTLEWDGTPLFLPQQIGASLEFTDPARFVKKLSEYGLNDGLHLIKVTGDELAALKVALGPDVIDPRTPSLVLLTESGLYRALMRSRAPKAEAFQEWLASEVLPALRRTGSYQLAEAVTPALSETDTHIKILRELHVAGDIKRAAFAKRIGELVKGDIDASTRADLVDDLVRLSGASQVEIIRPVRQLEALDKTPRIDDTTYTGMGKVLEAWVATCCEVGDGDYDLQADLYMSYSRFMNVEGYRPLNLNSWLERMECRFKRQRMGRGHVRIVGLRLSVTP